MLSAAATVVAIALSLLSLPQIPYVLGGESPKGMDCEGLVQYCVRAAGADSHFEGSNDMFRHDVSWVGTLEQAQTEGRLVPGAALFVVAHDGKEPAEYQGDGLGNAKHIGLYIGSDDVQVVSASSVAGHVVGEPLSEAGWTHVGWLKDVDYSAYDEPVHPSPDPTRPPVSPTPTPRPTPEPSQTPCVTPCCLCSLPPEPTAVPQNPKYVTITGPGSVRMRAEPNDNGRYMGSIPQGKTVAVHAVETVNNDAWYQVRYKDIPLWWIKDGAYLLLIY